MFCLIKKLTKKDFFFIFMSAALLQFTSRNSHCRVCGESACWNYISSWVPPFEECVVCGCDGHAHTDQVRPPLHEDPTKLSQLFSLYLDSTFDCSFLLMQTLTHPFLRQTYYQHLQESGQGHFLLCAIDMFQYTNRFQSPHSFSSHESHALWLYYQYVAYGSQQRIPFPTQRVEMVLTRLLNRAYTPLLYGECTTYVLNWLLSFFPSFHRHILTRPPPFNVLPSPDPDLILSIQIRLTILTEQLSPPQTDAKSAKYCRCCSCLISNTEIRCEKCHCHICERCVVRRLCHLCTERDRCPLVFGYAMSATPTQCESAGIANAEKDEVKKQRDDVSVWMSHQHRGKSSSKVVENKVKTPQIKRCLTKLLT
jgi:hypothetical protein